MNSWPYNDLPPGFALPSYDLPSEERQELTEYIWSALVRGETDPEEFADAYEEDWPLSREQLEEAFELARQARVIQQAQWTERETLTNLDKAFAELNNVGIVARQNFTCCGTCGAAEIGDERDDSGDWRGYVFFHQQDTESLIETGNVYLAYGVFPPKDFDREAYSRLPELEKEARYRSDLQQVIGDSAIACLTRHGLEVDWDGDLRTRILLRGAQWYTRL